MKYARCIVYLKGKSHLRYSVTIGKFYVVKKIFTKKTHEYGVSVHVFLSHQKSHFHEILSLDYGMLSYGVLYLSNFLVHLHEHR